MQLLKDRRSKLSRILQDRGRIRFFETGLRQFFNRVYANLKFIIQEVTYRVLCAPIYPSERPLC